MIQVNCGNLLKTKHLSPNVLKFEGQDLCNKEEIVNTFAQYFHSVFVSSSQPFSNFAINSRVYNEIGILSVDKIHLIEVEKAIKNLKSKSSVESDGIPSYIVKGWIGIFKYPLLIAFNLALKTCTFPDKWKSALVCPISKTNDRRKNINNRPIAILPVFAKFFNRFCINELLIM